MSEFLHKIPKKGILKSSSSFDKPGTGSGVPGTSSSSSVFNNVTDMCGSITSNRKSTKFDEMNIIETLHPPDKDYGHMKIEEPKTPFNYYEDGEDGETGAERRGEETWVDPVDLQIRLETSVTEQKDLSRSISSGSSSSAEEDAPEDPEDLAKRHIFESKRKAHYNEYYAVKLARKLLEQEQDEEDNNDEGRAVRGGVEEEEESVELNENEGSAFVPIEEVQE